jgi:hypothetical protein
VSKRYEHFPTIALPLIISALLMASPLFLLPAECPLFDPGPSGEFCHTIPPGAGCLCINEPNQGTAQVLFILGLGLFFVPVVLGMRKRFFEDSQSDTISPIK